MKKIITLLLSFILLTSTVACSSPENAAPVDLNTLYVPTYEKGEEKIPILSEMPPDFSIRSNFDQYIDSGMNTILIGEDYFKFGSDKFETVMTWCEEEKIDAIVRISKSLVIPQQTDHTPKRNLTYFEINYPDLDFKEYPAIIGFAICDEPSWMQILELRASYLPWFNENYGNGNYMFYNNFFTGQSPLLGKDFDGEIKDYDEYCNFYIEEVLLNALDDGSKTYSHDTYPIQMENGEHITSTNWLRADFNTANYCKKFGLTMGTYIQAYVEETVCFS